MLRTPSPTLVCLFMGVYPLTRECWYHLSSGIITEYDLLHLRWHFLAPTPVLLWHWNVYVCECVCCHPPCGGPGNALLICCGVANGRNPGLSRVVETRLGQGALQAIKRASYPWHAYTSCSTKRTEDQRALRTTLLSLAHLPSRCPPGQNFYTSNRLFSHNAIMKWSWPGFTGLATIMGTSANHYHHDIAVSLR